MKGAMLRCSSIAQREAARQRREAHTQFAGIFSTEIPLSPVGWLTVTVDALKHPPFLPGQNAPDAALWVVVRAVGAEQHAAAAEAAAREAGENGGAETLTAGDEVRFESSLNFAVRRPQLQDRSQQVVVEVHGSQGIHGSVALSLSRATRPGGEYDGVYELMHPEDPSGTNVARGYKQHATSPAPTSVFLRFYYVTSSQKSDRSSQPVLYSRGPVMPFSDKDLGMNRPASQKRTRPPSGALPSRGAVGILVSKQLPARPPSAQGRPQSAQPDLASHSDPRGPRSRLPSRPQSADPRQRPGQSSSFDEYPFLQPPLQLDFRPKSPTDTSGLARPQSATVRSKRSPGSSSLDPIFWDSARVTTSTGRPASAGARRPGNALMRRPASAGAYRAGSTPVSNAAIKTHVLMMPLARAAELKVRETAVKEDIIIPEITDEITDAQDAGNTSVFSIISREDAGSGLSLEARSILQQIEASARDWTGLQTLLKLPKEGISDVVKKLFDKVDTHREGSVPWDKFGDAMLLLCGKHFSAPQINWNALTWQDMELTALCDHYNVTAGSSISRKLFQEIAVDGLFVVARDELRNGDINNLGVTRCAQRLRFLRMDFSSSGTFHNPPLDTSPVVQDQNTPSVSKETPNKSPTRVIGIPGKRQQGTLRRTPIVMPVSGQVDLSCTGRSLSHLG